MLCVRQVAVLCCRNKKINLCVVREVRTRVVTVQLNKQIASNIAKHATLKKQICTFRSPSEHILLREHAVPPCLVLVIDDNLYGLMVSLSYILRFCP